MFRKRSETRGKNPINKSFSAPLKKTDGDEEHKARRKSILTTTSSIVYALHRATSSTDSIVESGTNSDTGTPRDRNTSDSNSPRASSSSSATPRTPQKEFEVSHLVDMGNFEKKTPGLESDYRIEFINEGLVKFAPYWGRGFYIYTGEEGTVFAKVVHGPELIEILPLHHLANTEEKKKLIHMDALKPSSDTLESLKLLIARNCEHKPFERLQSYSKAKAEAAFSSKFEMTDDRFEYMNEIDATRMLTNVLQVQKNDQMKRTPNEKIVEEILHELKEALEAIPLKPVRKNVLENHMMTLENFNKTRVNNITAETVNAIKTAIAAIKVFFMKYKNESVSNFQKGYAILEEYYSGQLKQVQARTLEEDDEGDEDDILFAYADFAYVQGTFKSRNIAKEDSESEGLEEISPRDDFEFEGKVMLISHGELLTEEFKTGEKKETNRFQSLYQNQMKKIKLPGTKGKSAKKTDEGNHNHVHEERGTGSKMRNGR